jgi:hypothetical protein
LRHGLAGGEQGYAVRKEKEVFHAGEVFIP